MSKTPFPYPLPADALPLFCHPAEWSVLNSPARKDGEILAGNGYLVIRCHRGGWIDHEFPEAAPEFLERVEKLPWSRWATLRDDWRALDEVRGTLFRRAPIALWNAGKLSPSPVAFVAGAIPVRLSMLQLICRLPRCEVYTGPIDREEPLWFRFSGGRGVIARDAKMNTPASFSIFEPLRDCLSGERLKRRQTPGPRLTQPGVNWPPVDMTDADTTHFND